MKPSASRSDELYIPSAAGRLASWRTAWPWPAGRRGAGPRDTKVHEVSSACSAYSSSVPIRFDLMKCRPLPPPVSVCFCSDLVQSCPRAGRGLTQENTERTAIEIRRFRGSHGRRCDASAAGHGARRGALHQPARSGLWRRRRRRLVARQGAYAPRRRGSYEHAPTQTDRTRSLFSRSSRPTRPR